MPTNLYTAIELIKERANLNDYVLNESKMENNFYVLEGINKKSGNEEQFIIYNCSENDYLFDMNNYEKVMNSEEGLYTSIVIFQNWQHETDMYWEIYGNCNSATKKKKLAKFFEDNESIYIMQYDNISLKVEDDINYLEYMNCNHNKDKLESKIYNISLFEMKKLFNITGKYLFDKNVRNGIKEDDSIKRLKNSFRIYIYVHILNELNKDTINNENNIERMKECYGIDENILLTSTPDNFWFYHNGITLFIYDNSFKNDGEAISFNPKNVSVINGAQTLTNFYYEFESAKRELLKKLDIDPVNLEYMLEDVLRNIFVKSIIIIGDEKFVRPITNGLNTQVPILNEHILATTDDVIELNKILVRGNIKILKEGESSGNRIGLGVLEFIKLYLTCRLSPGKSKNLRKDNITELIKEAVKEFGNDTKMLLKMRMVIDIDTWWKESKKERDNIYQNDTAGQVLNSYSKNYFESYVILKGIDEFDDEYMFMLYDDFVDEIKNIKNEPILGDFKKDDLFKKLINLNKHGDRLESEIDIKIDLEELMNYLNDNISSNYSISNNIKKFLKQNGISMNYFRVIRRKNQKCYEAFPFPSSSFSELYEDVERVSSGDYVKFKDSIWNKELNKEYPVFVLEMDDQNIIKKIKLIPDFSFKDYLYTAGLVYEKTIEAFQCGEINDFVKSSDDIDFHIRPKAIDATDTFEFSNGEYITKRTFWANRKLMNQLIDAKLEKSEIGFK